MISEINKLSWFLSNGGLPAPSILAGPIVTGNSNPDGVLSTTNGTWSNNPTSYSYQWLRNGSPILNQTNNSYTLITNDVGRDITCRVTAINSGGQSQATSNAISCTTTLTNGLIHWWEGGEGPADWANSVASAPSLVYTQGATAAVRHPFKRGYGTLVQTANNYETSSVQNSPNGAGSFTVAGWFSLNTTGSIQILSAQWGASNRRWRIYYDKTAGQFKVTISVNGSATATTLSVTYSETLLLKETTFYVLEHDAENDFIRLKIGNHVSLGSFTSTAHSTGIFNGTGQKIGVATDGNGGKASGWFGLTGIWSRKLTSSEHDQLWNYGRGIRYPFTGVDDIVLNENQFVFYVLGDTQHLFAPSGISALRGKETGWNLADMSREIGGALSCWHVGDVRHKQNAADANVPATWTNAKESLQYIIDKGIIFGPQYGNHDMDDIGRTGPGRLLTEYHAVFPQTYLTNQTGWNGGFYDSTLDNYYFLFTAGGQDFIVISLEAVPRTAVLTWAANLVSSNPTRKVIYISHQILSTTTGQSGGNAIFMDANDNTMMGSEFNPMGDRNNGSTQYNQVMKPYSNSWLAFCGHDNTSPCNGNLVQTGDNGNTVNLVLRNYQEEDNQSSTQQGWITTVTVDTQAETITLKTWNVSQQTYTWTAINISVTPADQNITLNY